MFVVYEFAGEISMAGSVERVPEDGQLLGHVELEDCLPILDAMMDAGLERGWLGLPQPGW